MISNCRVHIEIGEGCGISRWIFTTHPFFLIFFQIKKNSSSKVKTIQHTLMRLQSKGLNAILIVNALNSSLDRTSDRRI